MLLKKMRRSKRKEIKKRTENDFLKENFITFSLFFILFFPSLTFSLFILIVGNGKTMWDPTINNKKKRLLMKEILISIFPFILFFVNDEPILSYLWPQP